MQDLKQHFISSIRNIMLGIKITEKLHNFIGKRLHQNIDTPLAVNRNIF